MKKLLFSLIVVTFIISIATGSFAMPILEGAETSPNIWVTGPVTDSEGKTRNAVAEFNYTGSHLDVTLRNIAPYTHTPNEVLVGLFLDIRGMVIDNPHVTALGPVTIAPKYSPTDYGTNLDGEWGFRNDINSSNGGRGEYGIGASSYDPNTGDGFFSKVIDLSVAYIPPPSASGADFGIVSGDIGTLVASVDSFVRDAVHISFDVIQGTFTPDTINQVNFLYGTSYEGETPIPEPGTLLLLGTGLMGVAAFGRKKFKK